MQEQHLQELFARRRAVADQMLAAPHEFKVCGQCFSIAYKSARVCPFCAAYRWLESPEAVTTVATYMRTSPYPRNAGFPPRLFKGPASKTGVGAVAAPAVGNS